MSSWTQFFKEAGIPSTAAKRYAVIFEDNRITTDLLPDLSKDILADMGIKIMGDVLCILKHAKKEIRKTERSGSEGGPSLHSTTPREPDPVSTTSVAPTPGRRGDLPRAQGRGHVISPQYEEDQAEELVEIIPVSSIRSDHESRDYEGVRESYTTAAYSKKRQGGMLYSDDGPSPPKQPRVVVLPGERGQEMYTATALSRAAAIAAASAAIAATQQHIPEVSEIVNEESTSVFSRLDQVDAHSERVAIETKKPPVVQPARVTIDTSKPRTIKLGKEPKFSFKVPESSGEVSSTKISGLHSQSQPVNPRQRLGNKDSAQRGVVKSQVKSRSMVADEFDFQLKRQQDVRSRLESKEKAKISRRQGPLAGRLAKHNVFGRLE